MSRFFTHPVFLVATGGIVLGAAGALTLAPSRQLHATALPAAASPRDLPAAVALSDAVVAAAASVKPSVVYITADVPASSPVPVVDGAIPPEFRRFFGLPPMNGERAPAPRVERARASGSGFVVSTDGHILTNAHVVNGATRVRVRLLDRREFPATIVGVDSETDVALLKIAADDLVPAELGTSDSAQVGETVLAVGNPLGEELTFTVTEGIVSAKGRSLRLPNSNDRSIQDFIQTDAAINPGNSGGPLVDLRGRVIGINSAIASGTGYYTGYGFAVPIDLARKVMQQLMDHGHVERAALGVQVRNSDANDARWAGLDHPQGVVVASPPAPGSAAARAGLREGDLIVGVDNTPVDYVAQLQERVGFHAPGDVVVLDVRRKGGERRWVRVTLARMGEAVAKADEATKNGRDEGVERSEGETRLGITVAPTSDARAGDDLQLPSDVGGLVVTGIEPGSDAESHLLAPSDNGVDVLLSVNGVPTRTRDDVRKALAGLTPGDVVSLEVYNSAARTRRVERVRLSDGR
ncbi:MAG TPA: trypsin-like peptidase domain-containing protein [Gemmatimonadaceae bacterium]|nr:MAG: hypothetical protein ABS52_14170 [Gemmatimonadetes bacterium SCN 70-22]HMN08785.1 trypsin-like peptidase domain-containing protein [Gemmatimonadaceae bacterium]